MFRNDGNNILEKKTLSFGIFSFIFLHLVVKVSLFLLTIYSTNVTLTVLEKKQCFKVVKAYLKTQFKTAQLSSLLVDICELAIFQNIFYLCASFSEIFIELII